MAYKFLKMAAAAAQFSSRFLFVDVTTYVYQQTKFRRHNSIHGNTNVRYIKIRFRFRLYHRNRRGTLHQATGFHPNRTT